MIAVNDGVLLQNHVRMILRKHFRDRPYYVHLLDLFDEVIYLYNFCLISSQIGYMPKVHFLVFYFCIGGVSDCFRSDDRFDYHT